MHNAVFIGWGQPVRGREEQAARVFGEWVEMLGGLQSKGKISGMTPVFLNPRGGDLAGFFLITGKPEQLNEVFDSEELRVAVTRASLIVDNFGVVNAVTGDEIGKQMKIFTENAKQLSK